MISHPKFNFVFVAVSKTGSTSMRERFMHCGMAPKGRAGRRPNPGIDFQYPEHYNIREYRQLLGGDLDSRYTFGFVRNPWDRIVSNFTMACKSWRNRAAPRDGVERAAVFHNWVFNALRQPLHRTVNGIQRDWFLDDDGEIAVDFIGRFENIRHDFDIVMNRINENHPLPAKKYWILPHRNKSSAGNHYSFYYDDETIELVRDHFRTDIDHFGYSYDKSPG